MQDEVVEKAQDQNISDNVPFYVRTSVQYHDAMDQKVFRTDEQKIQHKTAAPPMLSDPEQEDVLQSVTLIPLSITGLKDMADHYGEKRKAEKIENLLEGENKMPDPEIFYLEPEGEDITHAKQYILKNGEVQKHKISAEKGQNPDFWRKTEQILREVNGEKASIYNKRITSRDEIYREGEIFPEDPENLIPKQEMAI